MLFRVTLVSCLPLSLLSLLTASVTDSDFIGTCINLEEFHLTLTPTLARITTDNFTTVFFPPAWYLSVWNTLTKVWKLHIWAKFLNAMCCQELKIGFKMSGWMIGILCCVYIFKTLGRLVYQTIQRVMLKYSFNHIDEIIAFLLFIKH